MGVLSALPIVSAGNVCCCLWVVSGGLVASYLLQQAQSTPITAAQGAFIGWLSGLVGAFVYLILSLPITFLVAPLERLLVQRIVEDSTSMPPEFRAYVRTYVGWIARLTIGFIMMLLAGSAFSTLGGLVGAVIFARSTPLPTPASVAAHEPPVPPLHGAD